MKRSACFFVVLTGMSLFLILARNSEAWVQTERPGVGGEMVPLAWDVSCFHYSIHEIGSDDVDIIALQQMTADSFEEWQNATCSYFKFVETDLALVDEIGLNVGTGNVNLLIWREEEAAWPTSQSVAALTTTSYDETDGKILDADIEFNGAFFEFGDPVANPEDAALWDLQSTITHEVGHTIGLDHSADPESTMADSYASGESEKRTLEQDDIDGICALYPLSGDPEICEEPYCGLDLTGESTECADPVVEDTCGCSAPGREPLVSRTLLRLLFLG